jgi:hypothetical protein
VRKFAFTTIQYTDGTRHLNLSKNSIIIAQFLMAQELVERRREVEKIRHVYEKSGCTAVVDWCIYNNIVGAGMGLTPNQLRGSLSMKGG